MANYHLRRTEKAIQDSEQLLAVIDGQEHMTLALCRDNEPYLVTVSYVFDWAENCFYFHCAAQGKKIDYLRANPLVWGQVLEDRGYQVGKCDYAFRTVQFRGQAEFVEDWQQKLRAFRLLIDRLDPNPESLWPRVPQNASGLEKACVVRVRVLEMSGKQGPVEKQ